ncbi:MAG: PINc/VapC family ATPase [Candidatus Micrarchaeota archaeon]
MKIIVPDTGVLIDGRITELLSKGHEKIRLVIARSTIAELEYQANVGREVGFTGLEELKKLQDMQKLGRLEVSFEGDRPSAFEIKNARFGEIDSKIRGLAKELGAILMTTDAVQSRVAQAEGLEVEYLKPTIMAAKLSFTKYFDQKNTLSVHLKENCPPKAKIGLPGQFELTELSKDLISKDEIERMVKEAIEFSKREQNSFIEIDKKGATVLQINDFRVTFTRPPFSEGFELTIVRPIAKLSIEDYELSEPLFERLQSQAEGILIAGPPGSGKSTLATALAEYYSGNKKIIKTLESPRDLQVSKEITQYAPLEGSFMQAADILLLVRPDYTIYDEIRKPDDFHTFSDLRLAGIGMVGVVHASKPIDAVQRFIGKIDLGMIPQVIDTILFVQKGRVDKVYELRLSMKVPSGMYEQDLSRPVIEVFDFHSKSVEYEIYKFGEETVVFPLKKREMRSGSGAKYGRDAKSNWHSKDKRNYAQEESPESDADSPQGGFVDEQKIVRILNAELQNYNYEVLGNKLILFVPEHQFARTIGKRGANITKLEKKLGMRIDVKKE